MKTQTHKYGRLLCIIVVAMTALKVWAQYGSCPNLKATTENQIAACTDCSSGITHTGSCSFDTYNCVVDCDCNANSSCILVPNADNSWGATNNATWVPMTGGTCSDGKCKGAKPGDASTVSMYDKETGPCFGG
jgi:hypothetical protein